MDIISAIVTSFVASVVFYVVFQYIPEKKRYNKIRPRVEVELMEITDSLFFYIELPFRHEIHCSSYFQKEIKERELCKKDFEMGLYNKCLNETFLFDENADRMIVIGDKLKYYADQLSQSIRNILMNQQYLTSEEILIVEDINRLLYTHQYEGNAIEKFGTMWARPINPTISYMHENFHKLYILWVELRSKMFNYKYIKKEERQGKQRYFTLQWESICWQMKQGNYEESMELIDKLSGEELSEFQNEVVEYLRLQIEIELGYLEHAKTHLEKIIGDYKQGKIVYQRGFLECVSGNKELMDLCSKLCSKEDLTAWINTVEQERKIKENFIMQNNMLREYYENKTGINRTT